MGKKNLKYLSNLIDEDMVTEDSLGNNITDFSFEGGFNDQEENNKMNKYSSVANSILKEINNIKECKRQQNVINNYGIDKAISGKEWEGTPYWSSVDGDMLIKNLKDNHLAKIPRHLYNNKVVKDSYDLPPKIVEEIKKRGFKLLKNCVVITS